MEANGLPFPVYAMMRGDSAYFHPVEWHSTMQMMSWVATGREVRWIVRDLGTGLDVGEPGRHRALQHRRADRCPQRTGLADQSDIPQQGM
jgi:hypothetical protein